MKRLKVISFFYFVDYYFFIFPINKFIFKLKIGCIIENSNKNNTNSCVEKEYVDNIVKDCQLIIYILALPPIDLIVFYLKD